MRCFAEDPYARVGSTRVVRPLFQAENGGSSPTPTLHSAKSLLFGQCRTQLAVELCREWHSRLPNTQAGPWEFAFCAEYEGIAYGVALWNTPSGRCLPHHWIELRRMALAPDVPKNTASCFSAWMVRFFRTHHPQRERCISYQDTAVHQGTMYKAAGWTAAHVSKPRIRDRSKLRVGTSRKYRLNINGIETDASAKVRWECLLAAALCNCTHSR